MIDPKIIDKVLSKNASPEEAREVAKWFSSDEGQQYISQRYDRESYLLNEKMISEWTDYEIPSKQMKVRFMLRLKTKVRTFRFRVVAAVTIPLILIAGAFTFVADRTKVFASNEWAEVIVPNGEQMQIILQDGTHVQLNSGTHFHYPKSFGLFRRQVKLTGEAYFSVAKETSRPFLVELDGLNIRVTGTRFNAKAYADDNRIIVSLEEGSVDITDKKNKTYPLKPGQSAQYNKESNICSIHQVEDITLHTAWRTKSLNFYRTPLKDILKTLERQYEVQFEVNDSSLLNYRFSISTNQVNAADILMDLEKVSKIRFLILTPNNYEVISLK